MAVFGNCCCKGFVPTLLSDGQYHLSCGGLPNSRSRVRDGPQHLAATNSGSRFSRSYQCKRPRSGLG